MKVLKQLGYSQPKVKDIEILKRICHVTSERAARLAAAGLAAIVKVVVILRHDYTSITKFKLP